MFQFSSLKTACEIPLPPKSRPKLPESWTLLKLDVLMFGALLVLASSTSLSWWALFFLKLLNLSVANRSVLTIAVRSSWSGPAMSPASDNAFKMTLLLSFSMALPLRFSQVMTVPFLPEIPLKMPFLMLLLELTDTEVLHRLLCLTSPHLPQRRLWVSGTYYDASSSSAVGCTAAAISSYNVCDAVSSCKRVKFCGEVGFILRLAISACSILTGAVLFRSGEPLAFRGTLLRWLPNHREGFLYDSVGAEDLAGLE